MPLADSDIDPNLAPLTEYELEQLIREAPRALRTKVARLCAEVKALRDAQGEREFMHSQEVAW